MCLNETVCRLCALKYAPIYLKKYKELIDENLDTVIMQCLQINLNDDKKLPKNVCQDCCNIIYEFYNYYNQVQLAQETLRNLILYNTGDDNRIKSEIKIDLEPIQEQDGILNRKGAENSIPHQSSLTYEDENAFNCVKSEEDHDNSHGSFDDVCNSPLSSDSGLKTTNELKQKKRRIVKWRCYKCDSNLRSPIKLEEHFQKLHNSATEYMCMECKALFQNLVEFKSHLNEHQCNIIFEYGQYYKCNKCNKQFRSKTSFTSHQCSHSEIKTKHKINKGDKNKKKQKLKWKCFKCNVQLVSARDLQTHFSELHSNENDFTCSVCQENFGTSEEFQNHIISHKNGLKKNYLKKMATTFDCKQCDKKCRTEHLLKRHLRTHLSLEEKLEHGCDICQKRFISPDGLKSHIKNIHENIQEFICDQCGKNFKNKYNLERHVQTHTSETPYNCDECSKTFKSRLTLKRHKLIHTGIKAHACEYCGKKFRLISMLNIHKRIHSNELPYECSYCKKGFRLNNHLKVHLRQHTGERPYACLECNHYFSNDSNFIKHLKGRHRLKNFSIVHQHQYPFIENN